MKSILALTVVLLIPSLLSAGEVKRYYQQEGTYIAPDLGTSPDGALDNNYSFRGNVRVGSGRIPPGETDNYRDRHYQVSPKKEQSYSPLNPFVLRW
jgi:hypothetical protein